MAGELSRYGNAGNGTGPQRGNGLGPMGDVSTLYTGLLMDPRGDVSEVHTSLLSLDTPSVATVRYQVLRQHMQESARLRKQAEELQAAILLEGQRVQGYIQQCLDLQRRPTRTQAEHAQLVQLSNLLTERLAGLARMRHQFQQLVAEARTHEDAIARVLNGGASQE